MLLAELWTYQAYLSRKEIVFKTDILWNFELLYFIRTIKIQIFYSLPS